MLVPVPFIGQAKKMITGVGVSAEPSTTDSASDSSAALLCTLLCIVFALQLPPFLSGFPPFTALPPSGLLQETQQIARCNTKRDFLKCFTMQMNTKGAADRTWNRCYVPLIAATTSSSARLRTALQPKHAFTSSALQQRLAMKFTGSNSSVRHTSTASKQGVNNDSLQALADLLQRAKAFAAEAQVAPQLLACALTCQSSGYIYACAPMYPEVDALMHVCAQVGKSLAKARQHTKLLNDLDASRSHVEAIRRRLDTSDAALDEAAAVVSALDERRQSARSGRNEVTQAQQVAPRI